jgi:putative ABC transport system permease protein
MLVTAARTAAGRLRELPHAGRAVLLSCLAGVLPTLAIAIAFGAGALTLSARNVIALGGIIVAGSMIACTLSGRQLLTGLRTQRDEVEGWLALGATPRQAVAHIARTAVSEALLPAIDQTRTVGLVALPGSFVGALFGGVNPFEAARFQLVVLVGLLAAETVTAGCLTWLLGAPRAAVRDGPVNVSTSGCASTTTSPPEAHPSCRNVRAVPSPTTCSQTAYGAITWL